MATTNSASKHGPIDASRRRSAKSPGPSDRTEGREAFLTRSNQTQRNRAHCPRRHVVPEVARGVERVRRGLPSTLAGCHALRSRMREVAELPKTAIQVIDLVGVYGDRKRVCTSYARLAGVVLVERCNHVYRCRSDCSRSPRRPRHHGIARARRLSGRVVLRCA